MTEKLFTPLEVAEILKTKDYNIRNWLRNGKIDGIKLPNGAYRITETTLNKILGNNETE